MPNGGPDAGSESESDRSGVLSYGAEWHAFTHGVYKGLTSKALVTPPEPDNPDVEKEPHYYRGGYVIGTIGQLLVAGVAVYFGVGGLGGGVL